MLKIYMECFLRNSKNNKVLEVMPFIITLGDILELAKVKAFKGEIFPDDTRLCDHNVLKVGGLKIQQLILPEDYLLNSPREMAHTFEAIQACADLLITAGVTGKELTPENVFKVLSQAAPPNYYLTLYGLYEAVINGLITRQVKI